MNTTMEKEVQVLLRQINEAGFKNAAYSSKVLNEGISNRKVVEYSFYPTEKPLSSAPILQLIGKFYPDEAGYRNYRLLKRLRKVLEKNPRPPVLAVPHVLFYDPRVRLLLQQKVNGVAYRQLALQDNAERHFHLAGKALTCLHSLRLSFGAKKLMPQHLRELIHPHPFELAEHLPVFRLQLENLVKSLQQKEKEWIDEMDHSPLHRDFHLGQLFLQKNCICLIDWDLFAKGDPALDVGNFLVYLETHLPAKSGAFGAAFLKGYLSNHSSNILKRVPLYKALTYLRLASKGYRLSGDSRKVGEMLQKGEECLREVWK